MIFWNLFLFNISISIFYIGIYMNIRFWWFFWFWWFAFFALFCLKFISFFSFFTFIAELFWEMTSLFFYALSFLLLHFLFFCLFFFKTFRQKMSSKICLLNYDNFDSKIIHLFKFIGFYYFTKLIIFTNINTKIIKSIFNVFYLI